MNTFDKIQKAIGISYKNKKHYHHDHINTSYHHSVAIYRYALSRPINHEYVGESGVFGVDKWRKRGEEQESSITITYYSKDAEGNIINDNYLTLENSPFTYEQYQSLINPPHY
jgi:hypothetical protein